MARSSGRGTPLNRRITFQASALLLDTEVVMASQRQDSETTFWTAEVSDMATTVTSLFRQAAHLGEGDRAALAGLLLESLEHTASPGIDAAWAEEIERRVRQLETGDVEPVPWDEVRARLLARENAG
jgi:putative addiction module component (TIGR02574 family)